LRILSSILDENALDFDGSLWVHTLLFKEVFRGLIGECPGLKPAFSLLLFMGMNAHAPSDSRLARS
jgi:hypothetical protein